MNVKYCGPARDYSGYGEANRHDIAALSTAGVELTTQIPHYCLEISDYGRVGDLAGKYENRDIPYQVKILHTTPNVYGNFMEPGKYHIARVFWETDKLPTDFSEKIQLCDEVWTGSEFNAAAIRKAGVTRPIYIIPEAIDTFMLDLKPYKTGIEAYTFYSIFEWTERKNPAALLEAYWSEFQHNEKVALVIKTYVDNFTPEKKEEILTEVRRIKRRLALPSYAPLYFFTNLMDRNQVYRFHSSFDCFVSAHHGEGWGIPQMEALLLKKPIISTNCGGIHEYLTNDVEAKLIPYHLEPLVNNSRNKQWYTSDQNWAVVSIPDFRQAMRWAFEHQEKAKEMGVNGAKRVQNIFSLEAVGTQMAKRLYEIGL